MAEPDQFEMVLKMNRWAPDGSNNNSNPVKFRQIGHKTSHQEGVIPKIETDYKDHNFTMNHTAQGESAKHIFFKDPMLPQDEQILMSQNSDLDQVPFKLGRNMRACKDVTHQSLDVHKVISKRKQLLEQQKEQKVIHEKEERTLHAATTLVNDLLQNGFHITPPDKTPRLDQSVSPDREDTFLPHVDDRKLIVAIHRELKRVQAGDIE
ncbi:unnamed protein product [Lymnaea stagnalis]|uniref:Uncharacterized protein n=1 Tax=Lymnaea stagnalis TaxID=6523 RepID=A0AAV2IJ11_LYMST